MAGSTSTPDSSPEGTPARTLRSAGLILLLFAGAALLAFGPRPGARLPPGRTVVTYWEKWTGNEAAQMQEIVDDFNATAGREKGIFVQYMSMSSVHQKTLVATAAGVPPDIAGLWDGQVAQFAALDAVQPLDEAALAAEYGICEETYKPVYWRACHYDGKLYGLVSTPWCVALHYSKRVFQESAADLRAAGLDPGRPPRSLDEVDRYARVLDRCDPGSPGRLVRAGYLPLEPGWFIVYGSYWFGGDIYDAQAHCFTLTSPAAVRSFEWIASYTRRLGNKAILDFRSGLGNFDSPQNCFLTGAVVMEQQGPWMANYIHNLKPQMSSVLMPKEEEMKLPVEARRENYEWAAAPFPSAIAGLEDVTYAGFDVFMIPRGARHKREALQFIAYANRQNVMEKICSLHSKNSPLRKMSARYLQSHPNPYIEVFERLAASPNARAVPSVPIMPEVTDELFAVAQRVSRLEQEPRVALAQAQERLQGKLDRFLSRQAARRVNGRAGATP